MAKRTNQSGLLNSYKSILALRSVGLPEIDNYVRKGITKKEVIQLKDVIKLAIADIANFIGITDRTIYLKKDKDTLDQSATGQIYSVALLYSKVYNAFQNKGKADRWMKKRNRVFGNRSPIEISDTITGRECVKEELMRMEIGIY